MRGGFFVWTACGFPRQLPGEVTFFQKRAKLRWHESTKTGYHHGRTQQFDNLSISLKAYHTEEGRFFKNGQT